MSSATILVVEDEPIVGMEIMEQLAHTGYNIPEIVQSGDEVLEAVGRNKPDLVLMDIKIDGTIDGIEAARLIRSGYDIPVLFLTAFSDPSTIDRAASAMPDGYLVKPFDERELIANVEIALRKGRQKKEDTSDLRKYVTIIDALSEPVCIFDEAGRLFHLNTPASRELGIPDAEGMSGFWLSDFVKGINDLETALMPSTHVLRTPSNRDLSFRLEYIVDHRNVKRGVIGFIEATVDDEAQARLDANLNAGEALKAILPAQGCCMPAINSAGFLVPGTAGSGDLYDIYAIDDNRYAFYSLDVMGNGTLASLIAYSLHEVIPMITRAEAASRGDLLSPLGVLAALNRKYFPKSGSGSFFTMSLGIVDLRQSTFTLARAGHTKSIIQTIAGENRVIEGKGTALGAFESVSIEEARGTLVKGDRVILCSDGLLEALGEGDQNAGCIRLAGMAAEHRRNPIELFTDSVERSYMAYPVRLSQDASLFAVELPTAF